MTGIAWGGVSGRAARVPEETHPALAVAARTALEAYEAATAGYDRAALEAVVADGADGTPTMRIDVLVEDAVLAALSGRPVNVLSEETGWVDNGSALTLVMDPVDGSANAAAGVPLAAFSAALAEDGVFTEALTVWLDTGRSWWARRDPPGGGPSAASAGVVGVGPGGGSGVGSGVGSGGGPGVGPGGTRAGRGAGMPRLRTTGRRTLDGAAVSMLRPHPADPAASAAWWAVTRRAARVRILSTSCLEAALVAQGATDAFADAATDTHRLVDIAAAVVLAEAGGGAVRDVFGRPVELDVDLTRRWSGIVAATPDLADELAETLRGAYTSGKAADLPGAR